MNNQTDFSITNIINSFKDLYNYLFINIKKILILTSSIFTVILLYNYLKSPIHFSRTTFVLDSDSSSNSIGDIASLASLAGINASSFIEASSLFQIDNIQEL